MLHKSRVFRVSAGRRGQPPFTLSELVHALTEHDWTSCTAFSFEGLIFANDSTGPDGAQEYAVIRDGRQIESLTVSWMKAEKLTEIIHQLLDGRLGEDYGAADLKTDHPEGSCARCA